MFVCSFQGLRWSPELVDVLLRHQILDDDEAIFLIEVSLFWGQQVGVTGVPTKERTHIYSSHIGFTVVLSCWQRKTNNFSGTLTFGHYET